MTSSSLILHSLAYIPSKAICIDICVNSLVFFALLEHLAPSSGLVLNVLSAPSNLELELLFYLRVLTATLSLCLSPAEAW